MRSASLNPDPIHSAADSALPLLRAARISRHDPVKGALLLHPFSLDVNAGDSIVLTGATGSGKSLLLRSLVMFDPVDDGEIFLKGERVTGRNMPVHRSQVAYVRQRPALVEGTVEQNLRLPHTLAIHAGRHFARDRALRLLDALGLPAAFLGKLARDLSGGEAQLVALVRVLLLDPLILLLDEPTAALDAGTTAAVESLLRTWAETGPEQKAMLLVTHSPEQARRLGRRHLHISERRLQPEVGPPPADARSAGPISEDS